MASSARAFDDGNTSSVRLKPLRDEAEAADLQRVTNSLCNVYATTTLTHTETSLITTRAGRTSAALALLFWYLVQLRICTVANELS